MKLRYSLILAALLGSSAAFAQMTPVGTWTTVDEKTGEHKAEITIVENNGVLSGKITKRLLKDTDPDAVCDKCTDDRKGKPLQGLEIIRGVKKDKAEGVWDDGKIIDPESGKVYDVKMTPTNGGKKMEVRGYAGISLLGRTQVWLRKD